jgi:L-asparaginase
MNTSSFPSLSAASGALPDTALAASEAADTFPVVPAARRRRIMILATGGTIAGASASATESSRYRAGALGVTTLIEAVPQLAELADIESEQFASIDSKDATLGFWCDLSKRVNAVLARPDVDGVVITHGTDTLEETAFWLHLTVASDKPVVITAAMRPATALSADGPANLFDAVTLAASPFAVGKGVLLAFSNRIHSARDAVKASSYATNAFVSGEVGTLGWVQDGQVKFARAIDTLHTSKSRFAREQGWSADELKPVHIVMSYAGVGRECVDALRAASVRGLIVAGTGNGSVHAVLQDALVEAVGDGVAVVRSSRVAEVRLSADRSADDAVLGFVASGTLNPFKARVLLILALSSGISSPDALRVCFQQY